MVYQQSPYQGYEPSEPRGTQPVQMQPEVKWSGLSTGSAFKIPVQAFIGRLVSMTIDTESQYGFRIVEKYDQVQILQSPSPWPWATLDFSIKYSNREESGWGRHIASAKALGLATNAATLDEAKKELIGKTYELKQQEESYEGGRQRDQVMKGNVWRFVRVVEPSVHTTPYVVPPVAPPVVPPVAPSPAPPVVQGVLPIDAPNALDPGDTPEVRAKKLLHGRTLNEWLGVALVDEKIAGSAVVNSIYDQSLIVGLKASGQVVQDADGRFQVIK